MKRFHAMLVVLVFCLPYLASPAAAQGGAAPLDDSGLPFGHLAAWVGKYPGEDVKTGKQARPGGSFFEDSAVLPKLKVMLPEGVMRIMVKGWRSGRVESPVERDGDTLKASFCKPHDCPDVNAAVFVNMRTGKVEACWHDSGPDGAAPRSTWYSPSAAPRIMAPGEDCFGGEGMGLLVKYGAK